ncbi:hypothetical protein H6P81_017578 [Aristolochia fimbriata]|uniref:glucomannan 4-beta-mannosyltransferase n=1 Tax=Aristolochia fimbriata TaxID=158543 RepID=A0AAV7DYU3_ARIFI|nr:hypothetical protein H6P81_017578 [Aristolochia fimbriata]
MKDLGVSGSIVDEGTQVWSESFSLLWQRIKGPVIVPLVQAMVIVCISMSLMLFVERVYMAIVIVFVKLLRKKRYTKYKVDNIKEEVERNNNHPTILVQIPMFNEKEVYRLSISAACSMEWPSEKLIIQVLDDSTNATIRDLVELECQRWSIKGINIKYETRNNRNGYKAGALRDGLTKQYVQDCEYVVIFDADFQPEPDFLWRTIPFLISNPDLGLVQARWKFVNADECMMTRLQEMSLDYHFSVEQEVGSSTYSFFGFNGTAGVWRLQALHDAGGWKDRTTVEDMDLAVRASLRGWKFVFIGDLSVKNELPSTFKAYRYQQHRWSCGPANLMRKMMKEILFCEGYSVKFMSEYYPESVAVEETSCPLRFLLREEDCSPLGHFLLLLCRHSHHLPERDVPAPNQGRHHRTLGSRPCERMGRHREAREHTEEQDLPQRQYSGGGDGSVPPVLCLLQSHVWDQPPLHLPVLPVWGVLRDWVRIYGHCSSNLGFIRNGAHTYRQ